MSPGGESRQEAVGRLAKHLQQTGTPRLDLLLILVLTGAVGLTASLILLQLGLAWMWLRYLIGGCLAYGFFLLSLRYWAQRQIRRLELLVGLEPSRKDTERIQGSPWGFLTDAAEIVSLADASAVGCFVIIAMVVIGILIGVVAWAPTLLAEALLDCMLMAGLWHRMKREGIVPGMSGAFRATRLPAAIVIACLGLSGFLLQVIVPTARSIGDVLRLM